MKVCYNFLLPWLPLMLEIPHPHLQVIYILALKVSRNSQTKISLHQIIFLSRQNIRLKLSKTNFLLYFFYPPGLIVTYSKFKSFEIQQLKKKELSSFSYFWPQVSKLFCVTFRKYSHLFAWQIMIILHEDFTYWQLFSNLVFYFHCRELCVGK